MGQYKLTVFFVPWQIGILIAWNKDYNFSICLPFVAIMIGLTEHAKGASIFGKEFN